MSLRLRLTFAASLLLAVLLLLGVLLVNSVARSELGQVDQQLRNSLPVARTLDQSSAPTFPPIVTSPKKFTASRFSAFYIAVIAHGKRVVLSTPLDAHRTSPQTPSAVTTPHHTIKIATVGSVNGSLQWRAVLLAVPHSKTEVLVAVSLAQIDTTIGFLRLAILLAALVVLAVVIATGLWIARLGLRPIAEVTEVADAITAGDRTRRVTTAQQRTEAGKLAQAFNLMLDEQLALEARLRQFIADASHELRTPVSVILGITELWRQGELRNGEERDEAIHRIGLSGNQMGKLVEELLLLARLDEGRPMDRAPVDLERLIHEVVADALTTDPFRTIVVTIADPVVVQGDVFRLRQVVANLVNNALRYTSADAVIEVRLSSNDDAALLDVVDSGPGMTPEHTSHAFDRFWQADASRSRSGAGLGLPIVRGIVVAHAGNVTLESDPETGTHVRVAIPQNAENRTAANTRAAGGDW
ncbi:MAG TPA: HAMP domain-containing sensor histidine kinase [Acidimicrobiales bacterium]|nr:HAMP domain-containing sensor histidine kinase [Acidimicrobiales bacterium]